MKYTHTRGCLVEDPPTVPASAVNISLLLSSRTQSFAILHSRSTPGRNVIGERVLAWQNEARRVPADLLRRLRTVGKFCRILPLTELLHAPHNVPNKPASTQYRKRTLDRAITSQGLRHSALVQVKDVPAVPYADSCLLELEAVSLPQLIPRLDTGKLGLARATNCLEEGLRCSYSGYFRKRQPRSA